MADLSKVAVVIRSYNNIRLQNRLDEIKNWGVARIFVISNAIKDNGVTSAILGRFDPELIKHITLTKHSWTAALNAAMACISMEDPTRLKMRYVLNASVETEFKKHHILSILEATEEHVVVGTSFSGILENDKYPLGPTYQQPRNTGMLINLELASGTLGFFNPMCDAWGGMEDTEFLYRARLCGKEFFNLDLKVPLLIGDYDKQKRKEKDEERAVETIKAFVRSLAPERADEAFFTQFEVDCMPRSAPNC